MAIDASTTAGELAAIVSKALRDAGITAVLSGGAAISLYTENRYVSSDLDFVTSEPIATIAAALAPLGFVKGDRRYFEHPGTHFFLEFPPGPLSAGHTVFDRWTELETQWGTINILSPTQMVMDRLAAYFHWNDPQSLDQAVLVATSNVLDWQALDIWAEREGQPDKYAIFQRAARRTS